MGTKEFLGLTLDGDLLKIARVRKEKGNWKLTHLERVAVKEEIDKKRKKNRSKEMVKDYNEDFHFGIDQSYDDTVQSNGDLDLLTAIDDEGGRDVFNSNVVTLKDELEDIDWRKLKIGMTIQTGDSNYQILKDKNYSQLKTKEIQEHIEDHLQKVYGVIPSSDHYQYKVREDGSLLLVSYKDKPYLLQLLDNVRTLSDRKIRVKQMLPDEGLLAALIKKNYKLDENEITCVIHMGFNRSRIFFMRGNQIQHAIAPIDEGRGSAKVLDVLFSKILFQLDTGEVSGLDRILITNNDLNGTSIDYFRNQFPDLKVDEFHFRTNFIDIPDHLNAVAPFFTSAIGAAISAAELKDEEFNKYSMLPEYVKERQNVLKLRWHGIMLLIFLLVTPFVWNYQYQEKRQQIKDLNSELFNTEYKIMDLEPVVAKANEIQGLYEVEKNKMDLLNKLSDGMYYWSQTLKTLNDGLGNIKHVWIDRIKYAEDGFMLQGYSMTRARIPQVTNLFRWADLKAVSVVEMRDVKLYKFSIKVYRDDTDDLDSKFERSPTLANNNQNTGTKQ